MRSSPHPGEGPGQKESKERNHHQVLNGRYGTNVMSRDEGEAQDVDHLILTPRIGHGRGGLSQVHGALPIGPFPAEDESDVAMLYAVALFHLMRNQSLAHDFVNIHLVSVFIFLIINGV